MSNSGNSRSLKVEIEIQPTSVWGALFANKHPRWSYRSIGPSGWCSLTLLYLGVKLSEAKQEERLCAKIVATQFECTIALLFCNIPLSVGQGDIHKLLCEAVKASPAESAQLRENYTELNQEEEGQCLALWEVFIPFPAPSIKILSNFLDGIASFDLVKPPSVPDLDWDPIDGLLASIHAGLLNPMSLTKDQIRVILSCGHSLVAVLSKCQRVGFASFLDDFTRIINSFHPNTFVPRVGVTDNVMPFLYNFFDGKIDHTVNQIDLLFLGLGFHISLYASMIHVGTNNSESLKARASIYKTVLDDLNLPSQSSSRLFELLEKKSNDLNAVVQGAIYSFVEELPMENGILNLKDPSNVLPMDLLEKCSSGRTSFVWGEIKNENKGFIQSLLQDINDQVANGLNPAFVKLSVDKNTHYFALKVDNEYKALACGRRLADWKEAPNVCRFYIDVVLAHKGTGDMLMSNMLNTHGHFSKVKSVQYTQLEFVLCAVPSSIQFYESHRFRELSLSSTSDPMIQDLFSLYENCTVMLRVQNIYSQSILLQKIPKQ